jgi:hypothetical protein
MSQEKWAGEVLVRRMESFFPYEKDHPVPRYPFDYCRDTDGLRTGFSQLRVDLIRE